MLTDHVCMSVCMNVCICIHLVGYENSDSRLLYMLLESDSKLDDATRAGVILQMLSKIADCS